MNNEEDLSLEKLFFEINNGRNTGSTVHLRPETETDLQVYRIDWQHGSVAPNTFCNGTSGGRELRAVCIWQHLIGDGEWLTCGKNIENT